MIIKVLGSAAGGGFPQWNCNCRNCAAVRAGTPGFRARTQSSLAVSRDGVNWVLLNASPDLRQQINDTPAAARRPQARPAPQPHQGGGADQRRRRPHHRPHQPARGAALLDLRLRPGARHPARQLRVPGAGRAAGAAHRDRRSTSPSSWRAPASTSGSPSRPSPCPARSRSTSRTQSSGRLRQPAKATPSASRLLIRPRRSPSFTFPAAPTVDEKLGARLKGASIVFFDGTLFTDDEMMRAGPA